MSLLFPLLLVFSPSTLRHSQPGLTTPSETTLFLRFSVELRLLTLVILLLTSLVTAHARRHHPRIPFAGPLRYTIAACCSYFHSCEQKKEAPPPSTLSPLDARATDTGIFLHSSCWEYCLDIRLWLCLVLALYCCKLRPALQLATIPTIACVLRDMTAALAGAVVARGHCPTCSPAFPHTPTMATPNTTIMATGPT